MRARLDSLPTIAPCCLCRHGVVEGKKGQGKENAWGVQKYELVYTEAKSAKEKKKNAPVDAVLAPTRCTTRSLPSK